MYLRIIVFTIMLQSLLMAADGDLDPTFGKNGMVIIDTISPHSFAIQSDGKIVVAGNYYTRCCDDSLIALARYNRDGTLDSTFGNNGTVYENFRYQHPKLGVSSIAINSDGTIIIAGSDSIRLNTDSMFALFSSSGALIKKTRIDMAVSVGYGIAAHDGIKNIAIQKDGKIVAIGSANNAIDDQIDGVKKWGANMIRLNSDLTFDNTFGTLIIDATGGTRKSIAIQHDGKIVVAVTKQEEYPLGGYYHNAYAVLRYNNDGTLDKSFDDISLGGSPTCITIQSNGKTIVPGVGKWGLVRYNLDGTIDDIFVFRDNAYIYGFFHSALASQSDGKIVAAGLINNGNDDDFALARYNRDGTLDSTFGNNGMITKDMGRQQNDEATSLAIQGNGKIVTLVIKAAGAGSPILLRYLGTYEPPSLSPIYYLLQ